MQRSSRTLSTPPRHRAADQRGIGLAIAVFVAVVGLDRVDLAAGLFPFAFTPSIVMSPLMIAIAVSQVLFGRAKMPALTSRLPTVGLTLIVTLLVALVLGGVGYGSERTPQRTVQLALLLLGSWAAVSLARRLALHRWLWRGAMAGVGIYVLLNIVQWFTFSAYGTAPIEFLGPLSLHLEPFGEGVVRLSGGSLDPNRAALTVTVYMYLLLADRLVADTRNRIGGWIYVITAALCVLTLSRSGILAFAIASVGVLGPIASRVVRGRFMETLFVLLIGLVALVLSPLWPVLESAWTTSTSRFESLTDDSASTHFALLERGLEIFYSAGFFGTLFGHGFGSAYVYLQDYFPDNVYANFHSVWVTVLVEGGLVSLLMLAILLVAPVFRSRRWLALSLIWFSVFYQAQTDAVYWLAVAVLWGLADTAHGGAREDAHPNRQMERSHPWVAFAGRRR